MTQEELYKMKLHGISHPDKDYLVMRVLGGWIYTHFGTRGQSSVFVPEQPEPIIHEPKPTVGGFFERRHLHD